MENQRVSKKDIFLYFIKLGCTGFGGPVALTAIMQKELVEERKWIERAEFEQAFPLIKAMPGALAFQTAAYIGNAKAGFLGAVIAGFSLVLPAAVMMILFGLYAAELTQMPWVNALLTGFQAGALALITIACWQLSKPYKKDVVWWILSILALGFVIKGFPEPVVIILFGALNILRHKIKNRGAELKAIPILELIWICFSAGAFVFGTGLAVLPWLESQFVEIHQWISKDDFMQAVALGQITPGPVLVTTTYIGFKISGITGAILATIAIFLPGLIHMTTWFPKMVKRLSRTTWIQAFSAGALAAVVATLIYVLYKYKPETGSLSFWTYVVMTALLFLKNIPSWLVILVSGLVALVPVFGIL